MMKLRHAISAFALLWLSIIGTTVSANGWQPFPEGLPKPDLTGDKLQEQWPLITRATQDPFPTDPALQDAWRSHFQGDLAEAKSKGLALGTPEGKYVAYRAQTIYAMYMTPQPAGNIASSERAVLLKEAADELKKLVDGMDDGTVEPNVHIRFWFVYTTGRYIELMKPEWGILTKKAKMKEMLKYVKQIPPRTNIPAFHAFRGGVYAGINEEGTLAKLTFRSYIEDCDGHRASYEDGTLSQFRCAEIFLEDKPFPEFYNSYAKALLQIDRAKYQDWADEFRQYATGASSPKRVTNMIFSAEDSFARNAIKKH
ncbi:hypothetical protein [Sansalvadorimonas verongulae]|uniref:hypothetical protein n=1 Tax=Sansalvadorimonas verongulae TaxID=2172824 RepID=UPI0012BCAA02|nr:hypothetical protein [Sansalvadorimonas verongulae]MTI13909.1 hypothetical protein [Sansalvadorimonas verongulae]